jgi:hypothetical protein
MVEVSSAATGVASWPATDDHDASAAPVPVASARPTTPRRVMAPTGALAGALGFSWLLTCGITARRIGLTIAPFSPMTQQSRPGENPERRGHSAPAIVRPRDDAPSQFKERLTLSRRRMSVNSSGSTATSLRLASPQRWPSPRIARPRGHPASGPGRSSREWGTDSRSVGRRV